MYLTKSQMERLPTKRLLAYKRKYLYTEGRPYEIEDWVWNCECDGCESIKKSLANYRLAYSNIKNVLNRREHITITRS